MDQHHIIYDKVSGKFVCWLKVMHSDETQIATILTADHILGPYTKVREERVHSETICANLTEDYMDVTGFYSTHFLKPRLPGNVQKINSICNSNIRLNTI